jgi:hypothetical protein
MIAYLDTNAFDHLYKKVGCTSGDIANLRRVVYGRQLSFPLSIHTLEEIVLARGLGPASRVARVKFTLSLASSRRLVKPCALLLADDIRAYAARGEAERPYLGADVQNIISTGIAELIETDGEDLDEEMIGALQETRRHKERFLTGMTEAQEDIEPTFGAPASEMSFEQYFANAAPILAERLARSLGVGEACGQRGIDGLLTLKSVRMSVGATLSLTYERAFEGVSVQSGDAADLQHAVSAAAVSKTFVSDDARIRRLLSRVPFDSFETTDLPRFLQKLA